MTLAVGGKVIAPPSLTNLCNHCRYALTHIYPFFQTYVCLVPEIWDTLFYGCFWYLLLPHCVNVLLKPFYNQTNRFIFPPPSRHFLASAVHHNGWLAHRRIRELSSLMAGCDKDIVVSGNRVKFVGTTGALVVLSVWRVWSILSHASSRSNSKVS